MAWTVMGSYAETCSCELMCPCNLSFDHGTTLRLPARRRSGFDGCEGEIDGIDVAGLMVVVIIDSPKVMTASNWRLGMSSARGRGHEQADKPGGVFGGQLGGPMAGLAPLVDELLAWNGRGSSSGSPGPRDPVGARSARGATLALTAVRARLGRLAALRPRIVDWWSTADPGGPGNGST